MSENAKPAEESMTVSEATKPQKVSQRPLIFQCPHPECDKAFDRLYKLKSHYAVHESKQYPCPYCLLPFARRHDLYRHARSIHSLDRPFHCRQCFSGFSKQDQYMRHIAITKHDPSPLTEQDRQRFQIENEKLEMMKRTKLEDEDAPLHLAIVAAAKAANSAKTLDHPATSASNHTTHPPSYSATTLASTSASDSAHGYSSAETSAIVAELRSGFIGAPALVIAPTRIAPPATSQSVSNAAFTALPYDPATRLSSMASPLLNIDRNVRPRVLSSDPRMALSSMMDDNEENEHSPIDQHEISPSSHLNASSQSSAAITPTMATSSSTPLLSSQSNAPITFRNWSIRIEETTDKNQQHHRVIRIQGDIQRDIPDSLPARSPATHASSFAAEDNSRSWWAADISDPIVERITSTTLLTSTGQHLVLLSSPNSAKLSQYLSVEIAEKFLFGFPLDWKALLTRENPSN
eukprot:jgi/Hompol1/5407/HPOL_004436-RA